MLPDRALCTLSGGFDSTAALLWSLDRWPTEALFVAYGQRYERQERRAVMSLVTTCASISKHKNFRGLRSVSCDMHLMEPGNPWIPYRNLVIASLATNIAAATGMQQVVFGSKSEEYRPEDPISYMDSTVDFYRSLEHLVYRFTEPRNKPTPDFRLPLAGWTKKEVLQYLMGAGVELRKLWNCYRGDENPEPCGECEHCVITQPLIDQAIAEYVPLQLDFASDATGST
jgi:7-cyano-7-deazaguanine synthase in queuosine biosynthesis